MTFEHVPGKNAGNVKLYALSTCPWCHKTKALLSTLGVEYYFVDVDLLSGNDRDETLENIRKWNPGISFPTLVINDSRSIVGFKEQEIRDALKV
jgi:glutaredoxin